jgi:hypothetical protein
LHSTTYIINKTCGFGDTACLLANPNILFLGRTAKIDFKRAVDAAHVEAQCQFADILIPKDPFRPALYFQMAAAARHFGRLYRPGKAFRTRRIGFKSVLMKGMSDTKLNTRRFMKRMAI